CKHAPCSFTARQKSRHEYLSSLRVHGWRKDLCRRFDLLRSEARSGIAGGLALQNLRIELAHLRIFKEAVLCSVERIALLQYGIVNQRILFLRNVGGLILVNDLRQSNPRRV